VRLEVGGAKRDVRRCDSFREKPVGQVQGGGVVGEDFPQGQEGKGGGGGDSNG